MAQLLSTIGSLWAANHACFISARNDNRTVKYVKVLLESHHSYDISRTALALP